MLVLNPTVALLTPLRGSEYCVWVRFIFTKHTNHGNFGLFVFSFSQIHFPIFLCVSVRYEYTSSMGIGDLGVALSSSLAKGAV